MTAEHHAAVVTPGDRQRRVVVLVSGTLPITPPLTATTFLERANDGPQGIVIDPDGFHWRDPRGGASNRIKLKAHALPR